MLERSNRLSVSSICACLIVFTLALALLPLQAFAVSDSNAARPENEATLAVQADDGATSGRIGNSDCEWKIEGGVLTIQPVSGNSGTLPSGPTDTTKEAWPWTGKEYSRVKFPKTIVAGSSLRNFFRGSHLTSIEYNDIKNLNTSKVTDMFGMFFACESLTKLDLGSFNTSNVENMQYMFWECKKLTYLNLSSFKTPKVTDLSFMFYQCENLTTINVSSFDTSNVTNMSGMFWLCRSVPTFNLGNFNTSKVKDMSNMFKYCAGLRTLNLSNFKTQDVTDMHDMFEGCASLTALNLSNFDTSNTKGTADRLFAANSALTEVTIGPNFNAQNAFPNKTWYNAKGESFKNGQVTLGAKAVYTTYDPTKPSQNPTGGGDTQNPIVGGDTFKKITMYRLYNPNSGEHLFTQDTNEYKVLATLGWRQEGVAWLAPEVGSAVYRLYNPHSGDHHYTTDENEYKTLGRIGWNQEGIAWRSGGDNPVYRLFNPNVKVGTHHYTTDKNEYTTLGRIGWKQENVGWYSL